MGGISLAGLRRHYGNFLTSGLNLAFLLIGLRLQSREGWLIALSLVAVASLFAWAGNFRRYRMINDTPTSRIGSAAQGYVEFVGRAAQHQGFQLASTLTGLPCLWFRYRVERVTGDGKWEEVDRGVSTDTFLLTDGSGSCVVDPEQAEVLSNHKQVWRRDNYRYTETLLLAGDPLYAIGEHATLGGANSELDLKEDVGGLLAQWKREKATLLRRFDLNGDGEIDLREWELARRQAQREVERTHREIRLRDGVHVMRKPGDDRLFLISNLPPQRLVRRYGVWAWVHLGFLLSAVVGCAELLAR